MEEKEESKDTSGESVAEQRDQQDEDIFGGLEFETTNDIEVPKLLIDHVIGQDRGTEIVKKAAVQRRHVMLIGTPGTGKSMLAKAMSELLPKEEMEDVLAYPNSDDPNTPLVRVVPAGKGKEIVNTHKLEARKKGQAKNTLFMMLAFAIILVSFVTGEWLMGIIAVLLMFILLRQMMPKEELLVPKLLVSSSDKDTASFVDATGTHAGALLGDVRHDPFQSGGLETPSHERVEAGAIHKAHKGVLFIDEINTLRLESQQNLLTAMQDKKFSITGQSERSSGALVKTEPVPCDFVMVCAGNLDAIQGMHPALRSRIKGYGYEVYLQDTMEDMPENRRKLVRFVAQEVVKDGKIPHFEKAAVREIIREARRRAGRKGQLTLRLRDLGGLVRAAGDIATAKNAQVAGAEHVIEAKTMARSVEQ